MTVVFTITPVVLQVTAEVLCVTLMAGSRKVRLMMSIYSKVHTKPRVLQCCQRGVAGVSQCCQRGVREVSQWCYRGVAWCYRI
jgi:hypothetical protein